MTLVTKTGVMMPNLQYTTRGTQVISVYGPDPLKKLSGRQRRKARKARKGIPYKGTV